MIYKVVILLRAEADLERNARWWSEHHSPAQAQRWLDTVYEQVKSLATSPETYALSSEDSEFAFDIRDKFVGLGKRPSYRAIFTIQAEQVFVLSIRRASQDAFMPDEIDIGSDS